MRTESPGTYLFGIPDRLGLDDDLAALTDNIYQKGLGKTGKPFLLISGIVEMLSRLHTRFPMAVVSARGQRAANTFLNQFELAPYFSVIVTGQTCRYTKPYPDPVLYAARQMGVSPEACLMIGDTTVDMRAGKAAGAQTVGVLCGFGERDELVRAGADLLLPQTPLLADLLLPA
jgi:HAD superfamily hydrolase (TIGR01549 family)